METNQTAAAACRERARAVRPGPALVPEEIVQYGGFDSQRGGCEVTQTEAAFEYRQRGQLNANADRSDCVETEQRHYRTGSARYRVQVCLTTETASTSAIPTIPTAPPISNRE